MNLFNISYLRSLKFNSSNSKRTRSDIVKKNILASFIVKGFSLFVSLLLVSVSIDYLDKKQYGIWLTLSSVLTWLMFMDIGIGNGLRNKFAIAKANGQKKLARIYISTTYAVLIIIIFPALLIFSLVNPYLNWSYILNTSNEMQEILSLLAIIIFYFTSLQFITKVFTYVLLADQKTALNDFLNLLSNIILLVVIYFLPEKDTNSIIYLGTSFSATPLVVILISSIIFFNKNYRDYKPSLKLIKIQYAKGLIGLGFKFFILQLSALIVFQSANIIIAHLCGSESVSEFNVAYRYFNLPFTAFIIILTPLWSAFTEAYTCKDIRWMENAYKKLVKFAIFFTIGVLLMLLVSQFVYNIWLGNSIIINISTSLSVAFYIIALIWATLFAYLLNGIGAITFSMYFSIFEISGNLFLAIVLGRIFGLTGILASMTVFLIFKIVWAPAQLQKLIYRKATGIWAK